MKVKINYVDPKYIVTTYGSKHTPFQYAIIYNIKTGQIAKSYFDNEYEGIKNKKLIKLLKFMKVKFNLYMKDDDKAYHRDLKRLHNGEPYYDVLFVEDDENDT